MLLVVGAVVALVAMLMFLTRCSPARFVSRLHFSVKLMPPTISMDIEQHPAEAIAASPHALEASRGPPAAADAELSVEVAEVGRLERSVTNPNNAVAAK